MTVHGPFRIDMNFFVFAFGMAGLCSQTVSSTWNSSDDHVMTSGEHVAIVGVK